ncbi:MAG: hypothetical protein VB858_11420, partial [Planctomycetaceae bacterium]
MPRLLCCLGTVLLTSVVSAQELPRQEPVADTDLKTTGDLLRGYSDQELSALRLQIPQRPEPELATPRPRLALITGTVFEDRNASGTRDADEPGLPNVAISDGERVLRSGQDGSFRFPVRFDENPHHRFVVMSQPTGFRPTRGFFVRIPFDGTEVNYSINFGLARDPASAEREFWFMTASD